MRFRQVRSLPDRQRGFTLVELPVVVVVIGILAAIAIPTLLNARDAARNASPINDASNLESAVASLQNGGGSVPVTSDTTWSSAADVPGALKAAGSTFSGSTSTLRFVPASGTAWCVQSVGTVGGTYAATDRLAVVKGSCSASGSFQASGS